jgi:hypothetical protein
MPHSGDTAEDQASQCLIVVGQLQYCLGCCDQHVGSMLVSLVCMYCLLCTCLLAQTLNTMTRYQTLQ